MIATHTEFILRKRHFFVLLINDFLNSKRFDRFLSVD